MLGAPFDSPTIRLRRTVFRGLDVTADRGHTLETLTLDIVRKVLIEKGRDRDHPVRALLARRHRRHARIATGDDLAQKLRLPNAVRLARQPRQ